MRKQKVLSIALQEIADSVSGNWIANEEMRGQALRRIPDYSDKTRNVSRMNAVREVAKTGMPYIPITVEYQSVGDSV